jgi:hypothetical protein
VEEVAANLARREELAERLRRLGSGRASGKRLTVSWQ